MFRLNFDDDAEDIVTFPLVSNSPDDAVHFVSAESILTMRIEGLQTLVRYPFQR